MPDTRTGGPPPQPDAEALDYLQKSGRMLLADDHPTKSFECGVCHVIDKPMSEWAGSLLVGEAGQVTQRIVPVCKTCYTGQFPNDPMRRYAKLDTTGGPHLTQK